MKIIFVCRANVGRSQMSEAIFNKYAPAGFSATSAGTKVIDENNNSLEGEKLFERESAKHVIEVLKELNIDVSNATRNQVTNEISTNADLVIVMAEKETVPNYILENKKVKYWDVKDPEPESVDSVRETRNTIQNLIEDLITELKIS